MTGTLLDITDRVAGEGRSLDAIADAQRALQILGAVAWEWRRGDATLTASVYGDAAWAEAFDLGQMSERAFLDCFDCDGRRALLALADSAEDAAHILLRLSPRLGGQVLDTRWVRRAAGGACSVRLLGVGVAVG